MREVYRQEARSGVAGRVQSNRADIGGRCSPVKGVGRAGRRAGHLHRDELGIPGHPVLRVRHLPGRFGCLDRFDETSSVKSGCARFSLNRL